MNPKMKECFTPHVMMHSLFGLGLGMIVAAILGHFGVHMIWLGIIGAVCLIVAFILDMRRK